MTSRIESLTNHAANLVALLEFWEDLGKPKPKLYIDELERTSTELDKVITERNDDETRQREFFETGGEKDGAGPSQSEPMRGGGVGVGGVSPRREAIRRPGAGSADGETDTALRGKSREA